VIYDKSSVTKYILMCKAVYRLCQISNSITFILQNEQDRQLTNHVLNYIDVLYDLYLYDPNKLSFS